MKSPLPFAIIGILIIGVAFIGHRYHFGEGAVYADEIAEWAVHTGRGPEECQRIILLSVSPGPTQDELHADCIYTFAKLSHDPTACKLLLPSDYGMMCIGVATEQTACVIMGDHSVRWLENNKLNEASPEHCKIPNTLSVRGKNCCYIGNVAFRDDVNSCDSISNDVEAKDFCFSELANKNRSVDTCKNIQSANLRSACEVRVNALNGIY